MEIIKIKNNIFPLSRDSIENYNSFSWHIGRDRKIDTDKVQSSQAVMIDVFGLLKQSKYKDQIINSVFNTNGNSWRIEFEYSNSSLLNEPTPTQIDVLLENEFEIVIVECKFTEFDGGECSQKDKISKGKNAGLLQCNGNYQNQVNPINLINSKCALTGKGIKYWDYIKNIYEIDTNKDYMPCPFSKSHYQWMRNMCTAQALADLRNKKSRFFICYYDSDICKMKEKFDFNYLEDINKLVKPGKMVKSITYNELIDKAISITNNYENCWSELKDWLNNKVEIIRRTKVST